jgi:YD repeat-containing protein
VLLTWHPLMAPPGVTYNVYRSATAPVPVDDAHRIASGLRVGLYLDRGGRAGLYYVVTAQNAAGESGPSNTAQAGPWPKPWPPKPPEPPIPPPIEFHWPDLTLLLPAPLLLVALGRSRQRKWAAPVEAVLLIVAVVCMGATLLSGGGAKAADGSVEAAAAAPVQPQQGPGEEYLTRVITYTYDPLHRLTGAEYSTGESFAYAYDAVGNRTAYTATTPLSGTLVTNYTYDAARRLIARAVSDGRTYTYTWSARGQMLAEYTHGYPVRTFTYDGAGRLTAATVFTLTTRFTYTGLGDRVAVEVVGRGVTTYTLDLVAGGQILAEETLTGRVVYLYGHECLGELRDGQWLYYLAYAEGLVRQGVDAGGEVVSSWLFDPNGVVLEGPEGPVSHLVCGGVYE